MTDVRASDHKLRERIREQRKYPTTLGYSCTAMGEGGAWRQGYEAAIDDVLTLLDQECGAECAKNTKQVAAHSVSRR